MINSAVPWCQTGHGGYCLPALICVECLSFTNLAGGLVDGVRFERLKGQGHHYPVLLHVGWSYVPVTESTITELKAQSLVPGDRFLEIFLEKLGYSDYLKERIRD